MFLRTLIVAATVWLAGCAGNGPTLDDLNRAAGAVLAGNAGGPLGSDEIARGLKQALSIGSTNVTRQLGQANGFGGDANIRIPLPRALSNVKDVAAKVGLDSAFGSLENRLNEAAEAAVPKARAIFLNSIQQMTLADAKNILSGPDDAATQFFRQTSSEALSAEMRPIVDNSLTQVGAVRAFDQFLQSYRRIPLAPKVDADLTSHVVQYALDGVFFYVAREEKAIRENPLRRTTDLLRRVFAGSS